MNKRIELTEIEKTGQDLQKVFEAKTQGMTGSPAGYSLPSVLRAVNTREGTDISTMSNFIDDVLQERTTIDEVVDDLITKAKSYNLI